MIDRSTHVLELAYEKGAKLLEAGCVFSEFGTRRRRSYHVQDVVLDQLIRAEKNHPGRGKLSATSNVSPAPVPAFERPM
jgi:nicotinate phosphoribosyltransferase